MPSHLSVNSNTTTSYIMEQPQRHQYRESQALLGQVARLSVAALPTQSPRLSKMVLQHTCKITSYQSYQEIILLAIISTASQYAIQSCSSYALNFAAYSIRLLGRADSYDAYMILQRGLENTKPD